MMFVYSGHKQSKVDECSKFDPSKEYFMRIVCEWLDCCVTTEVNVDSCSFSRHECNLFRQCKHDNIIDHL